MSAKRKSVSIDDRGRAYLTKLGFEKGTVLVADPVEGDELAWIIWQGRVVTDLELSILSDLVNLESLVRAWQETVAGAGALA